MNHRIAFLGLGAMGQRMAKRLVDAGHRLTVWNRSPVAAKALQAQGADLAASPRAAVGGADFVFSMVFDDTASRRVWLDPNDGAAAAMPQKALAIEYSTLTPQWIIELRGALASRGVALLDAPLAGSRPQADAGQLVFMLGGEAADVERARPLLMALGGAAHHVGGSASGAWLKLVVNSLFATQVATLAEQMALLRSAGVDAERALLALKALPVTSPAAAGAATLMLARQFAPQAPVSLIAKDLAYALRSAASVGAALPVTAAVAQRFEAAQAAGFGAENLVAVAKLYD